MVYVDFLDGEASGILPGVAMGSYRSIVFPEIGRWQTLKHRDGIRGEWLSESTRVRKSGSANQDPFVPMIWGSMEEEAHSRFSGAELGLSLVDWNWKRGAKVKIWRSPTYIPGWLGQQVPNEWLWELVAETKGWHVKKVYRRIYVICCWWSKQSGEKAASTVTELGIELWD